MKLQNNFVSIVILGNFNPSILTPDFLKNNCKVDLTEEIKSNTTPVGSIIESGDILFIVELDRFQISHKGIKDFRDTPIIDYTATYLDVLKYTPIFRAGINFNCTLLSNNLDSIKKLFVDKDKILEILNIKECVTEIRKKCTKLEEEYLRWYIAFSYDRGTITRIEIRKKEESYLLNYNYEVEELDKERKLLRKLISGYHSVLDRYEEFIKDILKEVKK